MGTVYSPVDFSLQWLALVARLRGVHGLSSSDATWDLPGPGIEPVSPALAGRFFTTQLPEHYLSYSFSGYLLSEDSGEFHSYLLSLLYHFL